MDRHALLVTSLLSLAVACERSPSEPLPTPTPQAPLESPDTVSTTDATCLRQWSHQTTSSEAQTRACLDTWFRTYGPGIIEPALLDRAEISVFCTMELGAHSLAELDQVQKHAETHCNDPGHQLPSCVLADNLVEDCRRVQDGRYDFVADAAISFRASMEAPLRKLTAGGPLVLADLEVDCGVCPLDQGQQYLSKHQLVLLRNAIFARHGRSFTTPSIQEFFYGRDRKHRFAGMNLPDRPDPGYEDARLTRTDRDNIRLLLGLEKRL